MLFECATITSITPSRLTLRSARGSACERCTRGEGCGGGIIGKLIFRRKPDLELDMPASGRFTVGQRVELSVPARRLMALAALVYLTPLAGLVIGALCGHWLLGSDGAAIVTSITGLVLATGLLKSLFRAFPGRWLTPTIGVMRGDPFG